MLRIHTRDGKTHRFDLADPDAAEAWMQLQGDPLFQETITAVTLARDGVQYSIARPAEGAFFSAENVRAEGKAKGGERLFCHAGDWRVGMMVHAAQRATRIDLVRMGRQRFNPLLRR